MAVLPLPLPVLLLTALTGALTLTLGVSQMWARLAQIRPDLLVTNSDRLFFVINKWDERGKDGEESFTEEKIKVRIRSVLACCALSLTATPPRLATVVANARVMCAWFGSPWSPTRSSVSPVSSRTRATCFACRPAPASWRAACCRSACSKGRRYIARWSPSACPMCASPMPWPR